VLGADATHCHDSTPLLSVNTTSDEGPLHECRLPPHAVSYDMWSDSSGDVTGDEDFDDFFCDQVPQKDEFTLSDQEISEQVAIAMNHLSKLELYCNQPEVRALFVRWTIHNWATQGPFNVEAYADALKNPAVRTSPGMEDDNEEGVETHLNAVSPVSVTATEDTVAAQDMFLDEEEVQPKTAQAPVQDMQSECHVSSGPDDMQPGQLDGPSMDPGTPELQEPAIPSAKHLETPPMDVNRFVCAKGRRFRPAKHHKHHKDEVLGHISCAGSVMVLAGIAPSSVVVG
jgi:hypothetical protein